MARFEVLVPAAPPGQPADVALRLDAEHWLGALRAGLRELGGPDLTSHVLCDVQPDGVILVTHPASARVFRIRELAEEPRGARPFAGRAPAPAAPAPARLGRAPGPARADDVLAELFEEVSALARQPDRRSGLAFLLDLALEKVDAEAGSVLLARLGGAELEFDVARGPRAEELLRLGLTVPIGGGLAGFCVRENVCLAVSDPGRDPRFHREVSEAIGYETRSLLCAPIAREGRVLGVLEVLNKRGGRPFDGADLAVVAYLAHQAASLLARLDG